MDRYKHSRQSLPRKIISRLGHLPSKRTLILFGSVVAVFALANVIVFFMYKNQTYPKTSVGRQQVGSLSYDSLAKKLGTLPVLPVTVQVRYKKVRTDVKIAALGISVNAEQIEKNSRQDRSWFPAIDLLTSHAIPVAINIDKSIFNKGLAGIKSTYEKEASTAELVLQDGLFSVKPAVIGVKLDQTAFARMLATTLESGQTTLQLPVKTEQPEVTQLDQEYEWDQLKQQQNTPVTFNYVSKTKQLSPQEVGTWFVKKGTSYELSDSNIRGAIVQIGASAGIQIKNLNEAVAASRTALETHKALAFSLIEAPQPAKTYSYCVAAKGVDSNFLPGLKTKLNTTYNDARGWTLGGKVALLPAESNCSFTVWLSAASQMSSFGAICDADWSCRVGPNVVINFDRWQGASSAWNAAGGTLDEYRSMVINHETGHWFGFNHTNCTAAGQPAPVMQQQSIDLQGCTFNAWPTAGELAALKATLGI